MVKNKKYAITFGLATLVAPILPVALVVSCGDDTVTPAQQAVNDEQAKINALQTHAITAGVDGVAANNGVALTQTLATQLGIDGFNPDTGKFDYILSNPALTQSGPLSLTITVSDKANPAIKGTPHALSVAVTVIVSEQAKIAANKNYLQTVIGSSLNGHVFASVIVAPSTSLVAAEAQLHMAPPNGGTITLPYPDIDVKVTKVADSTNVSYTIGGVATITVSFAKFAAISLAEFDNLYPGKIINNKVVDSAFDGVLLPAGFTLPDEVLEIGGGAFSRDNMPNQNIPKGFTIPESVTSIGDGAFKSAILPVGFTIPKLVTSIGPGCFAYTTIPVGFTIPASITLIDNVVFLNATFPNGFTIPESVTAIRDGAFLEAHLPVGFVIPKSVISIGGSAFSNVHLPTGCHWEKDGVKMTDYPTEGGHDYKIVAD